MEVNFSDFTSKRSVHDYLVNNSKKRVIKIESRLLDQDGVVIEHSDTFLENCGDIKYYFDDDESLEINRLNSVAIFVRGNGEKLVVDYIESDDFEPSFIDLVNRELGLEFKVHMRSFDLNLKGKLSGDLYEDFSKKIKKLATEYSLNIVSI